MRALVTGSAGFVGRHMVAQLERRGWEVLGCDLISRNGRGSVDVLRRFAIDTTRYGMVMHCAAQAPHRAAIDGQPATHVYNQLLDAAMFDWAIRTGQRRVLYFSSSAAYPVSLQCDCEPLMRLKEDQVDLGQVSQPDASYGWTKLTGERMAASARAAGIPVTVVRPFSGYGEDQSLDFPFPAIVKRAREGDLSAWGPPGQTRDWIHIDDVIAGALAVVKSGTEEPVNLCTGIGTEMGDLSFMAARLAGWDPVGGVKYLEDKPTGVMYRVGDPARMLKYYTPKVSLEEGIKRALAG